MTTSKRSVRRYLQTVLVLLAASSTGVVAQEQAYEAPVIEFDPQGVSLVEAVRLTLEYEPFIKLQDAAVDFQAGLAQEQTGFFDFTLLGNLFTEYRVQELTESRKQTEREKRDQLQEAVDRNREDANQAETLIDRIQAVRDAPPGSDSVALLKEADPEIGAQVEVIDVLIAAQDDPVARDELLRVRQELLGQILTDVQGGLVQLVEGFQDAEQSLFDLGAVPQDEVFYNVNLDLQLSKLFRTGISLTPFVNSGFEGTNFRGKPRDSDFGGKGLEDLFTFRAGLSAVVPLGRGRGTDATGAGERASFIDYGASRYTYWHEASVSTLNTVLAYWDLEAAQQSAAIAMRSVELQQTLLEATRQLIAAGEIPEIDIARTQASEARSRAALEAARRSEHVARVGLATAIGTTVTDDDATLPSAGDDFPVSPDENLLQEQFVMELANEALNRRSDLLATRAREESGQVLERRAQTDLRPRVDVVASTFYTALDERVVSNALDRWVGPSVNVALEYEKPLANNVYRGRLAQSQADLLQRRINSVDLRRLIQLAVVRSARSLQQAIGRVALARAAVGFYETTLGAEIERLRASESTLVDTILTEQQLTEALLSLVAAQKELAQLIAELRFESGQMLTHDAGGTSVFEGDLVTVPGLPRRAQ